MRKKKEWGNREKERKRENRTNERKCPNEINLKKSRYCLRQKDKNTEEWVTKCILLKVVVGRDL